jgi:hypothetical protein
MYTFYSNSALGHIILGCQFGKGEGEQLPQLDFEKYLLISILLLFILSWLTGYFCPIYILRIGITDIITRYKSSAQLGYILFSEEPE